MIRSLQDLGPEDEIIIVGDEDAMLITSKLGLQVPRAKLRYLSCDPGLDWGHTERQYAMQFAEGTHLVFGDDDDAFLGGAVRAIKEAIGPRPEKPIMFRMIDPYGAVLWHEPEVKMGNHGTPQ